MLGVCHVEGRHRVGTKKGPSQRKALFLFGFVNYGLEVIVETNAEVVQVGLEVLGFHVALQTPTMAVVVVGIGAGEPHEAEEVNIDVHGELVAQRVVQARDDTETHLGVVVTILDGRTSHFATIDESVGFALKTHSEAQLSLGENGEVLPRGHIVAEVRIDFDSALGPGIVGFAVAGGVGVGTVVGVVPTELGTNLHVLVQLIADFGHDADGGCGSRTSGEVFVVVAIVVDTEVATNNKLSISGHGKCCESEGQKNFFHFFKVLVKQYVICLLLNFLKI